MQVANAQWETFSEIFIPQYNLITERLHGGQTCIYCVTALASDERWHRFVQQLALFVLWQHWLVAPECLFSTFKSEVGANSTLILIKRHSELNTPSEMLSFILFSLKMHSIHFHLLAIWHLKESIFLLLLLLFLFPSCLLTLFEAKVHTTHSKLMVKSSFQYPASEGRSRKR